MGLLDASHPDRAVVEVLIAGDEGAFRSLVEQHYAAMLRVARRYVTSLEVAEEVVQDTWLALIGGLPRFEGRGGSTLKTWLFTILVNQARTRGARDHRVVPFSSLPAARSIGNDAAEAAVDGDRFLPDDHRWGGHWSSPPRSVDPTAGLVEDVELRRMVEVAVAALPSSQQQVVWLRDVEGWTAAEVCDALELSEANQRVLLHRGRSRVRAALERGLGTAVSA